MNSWEADTTSAVTAYGREDDEASILEQSLILVIRWDFRGWDVLSILMVPKAIYCHLSKNHDGAQKGQGMIPKSHSLSHPDILGTARGRKGRQDMAANVTFSVFFYVLPCFYYIQ